MGLPMDENELTGLFANEQPVRRILAVRDQERLLFTGRAFSMFHLLPPPYAASNATFVGVETSLGRIASRRATSSRS